MEAVSDQIDLLIVVADKINTIGCSDGTSNTNQEPGIMKMQQKK